MADHGGHGHGHGHGGDNKPKHQKALGKGLLGETPAALQPTSRHDLRQQAQTLMARLYAPVFQDLNYQERSAQSIYQKRQSDNQYYLNWLEAQQGQLDAHAQSSDQQLLAAQQDIAAQSGAAMSGLRDKLVANAASTPGTVSNPQQATAFDTSAAQSANAATIANERTRTVGELGTASQARQFAHASNAAYGIGQSFKAQSDLADSLKEIANARQKAALERSSAAAQEVSRLMDQEVTKAQSVVDMRNMAAQLAIALKAHRLDKARLLLDQMVAHAQISQDAAAQAETHRHNVASEQNTHRGDTLQHQDNQADNQQQNQENQQQQNQDQRELQQQAQHDLGNAYKAITTTPALQTLLNEQGPAAVAHKLAKKYGVDATYALAAAQYVATGSIPSDMKKELRSLGIDVSKLLNHLPGG